MNYDLSDKFNAIFNSGKSIRFQNVTKTKKGVSYNRIMWEEVEQTTGEQITSCFDWWGFDTIEDAVEDCLTRIVIEQM